MSGLHSRLIKSESLHDVVLSGIFKGSVKSPNLWPGMKTVPLKSTENYL